MMFSARRALRRFRKDDDGTATVEGILWMPVFLTIIIVIADASLLFNAQAQMLKIVQDGNRAYSTGQLLQPTQVETYVLNRTSSTSSNATVQVGIDNTFVPAGVITTTLTIPAADLVSIGLVTALANFDLSVSAQHYVEF